MVMLNVGGPAARQGKAKTMAGPCTVVADRAVTEGAHYRRRESGWVLGTVADRRCCPGVAPRRPRLCDADLMSDGGAPAVEFLPRGGGCHAFGRWGRAFQRRQAQFRFTSETDIRATQDGVAG